MDTIESIRRIRQKWVHVATVEARRLEKRGHPKALPLLLEGVDRAILMLEDGYSIKIAVDTCFNGGLQKKMLDAACPKGTQ